MKVVWLLVRRSVIYYPGDTVYMAVINIVSVTISSR